MKRLLPYFYQHWNTGKERDLETGWDYFGARYYNPSIARWMNVDPMADKFPSLSSYNYVFNNPIQVIDPDGQDPTGWIRRFGSTTITWDANVNSDAEAATKGVQYLGQEIHFQNASGRYTYGNTSGVLSEALAQPPLNLFNVDKRTGFKNFYSDYNPSNAPDFNAGLAKVGRAVIPGIDNATYLMTDLAAGKWSEAGKRGALLAAEFGGGKLLQMGYKYTMTKTLWKTDYLKKIANSLANKALRNPAEPGSISVLETLDGRIYEGWSRYFKPNGNSYKSELSDFANTLGNRNHRFNYACSDVHCFLQVIADSGEQALQGATLVSRQVRHSAEKYLQHNVFQAPCTGRSGGIGCTDIVELFNVKIIKF